MALCLEIALNCQTYWLGQINQGYCMSFRLSINMLSFDGVFCYDKHNIFLWKFRIFYSTILRFWMCNFFLQNYALFIYYYFSKWHTLVFENRYMDFFLYKFWFPSPFPKKTISCTRRDQSLRSYIKKSRISLISSF